MKNINEASYIVSVILKSTSKFKDNAATDTSEITTHTATGASSPIVTHPSATTEEHTTPNSTCDSPTTGNTFTTTKETPTFRDIETTTSETLTSTTKIPSRTKRTGITSTTSTKPLVNSSGTLYSTVKSLLAKPQSITPYESAVTTSSTTVSHDAATEHDHRFEFSPLLL
ncbi:hypothetical protein GOODEAATRI_017401 [Goodea atripinnis]|uniref:Uncharacterized protein n=1 Tax=Goodea atripinnis TaxID=208336 RepID=A0ABV0NL09_9TELE